MNTIAKDQNLPENLKLLKAQRYLYSKVKIRTSFRLILALLLLLFPVLTIWLPYLKDYELAAGASAVVIGILSQFFIKKSEQRIIQKAAHIQDRFDLKLFQIRPNDGLYDTVSSLDDIEHAAAGYGNDTKGLENWYADGVIPESLQREKIALICQRNNLAWDGKLRDNYAKIFLVLAILTYILSPAVCAYLETTARTMLNMMVLTAPFLILCIDNYVHHRQIAKGQLAKVEELDRKLENNNTIIQDDLQNTQVFIYKQRKEPYLVPNWFYNIFRPAFENTMKNVTITFTQYN